MILLFQGARQVVKADSLIRKQGLSIAITPVPERYSSECGMAIRIDPKDQNEISELLHRADIHYTIADEKE